MSINVSEATEKGIIRDYSHLTKEDVTWMFKIGELTPVPIEDMYMNNCLYERLSDINYKFPFRLQKF